MKKIPSIDIWSIILIITLLFLSIWGIFFVENQDSKISIFGIVAVIIAAITSVMTVIETKKKEHQLLIQKEKQKVVAHFYNALFKILRNIKNNEKIIHEDKKPVINKEIEDEMYLFKKGLMNWGSERLINKFYEYEINTITQPENFHKVANTFLKEIRYELGLKDSEKLNIFNILLKSEDRIT